MDFQFTFGPNNAYFIKTDTKWGWSAGYKLPEPLRRVLEDPNHPEYNQFPYDVALAMEPGVYAMCWRTKTGQDYFEPDYLGPAYAKLAEFLANRTSRTTFGPNRSYFSTNQLGLSWQNLPLGLEKDIMNRIKAGRPQNVALGMNGSWVVLYDDGVISYNLSGLYPELKKILDDGEDRKRRNSIVFVALSPYNATNFFLAFGDSSTIFDLPNEMHATVRQICTSIRPLASAARPPGAQPDNMIGAVGNFALAVQANNAMNSLFYYRP